MSVVLRPPANAEREGLEHWQDRVTRNCLGSVCHSWPTAGWDGEGEFQGSFSAGWARREMVVARRLEPSMAQELVARLISRRDVSTFNDPPFPAFKPFGPHNYFFGSSRRK